MMLPQKRQQLLQRDPQIIAGLKNSNGLAFVQTVAIPNQLQNALTRTLTLACNQLKVGSIKK